MSKIDNSKTQYIGKERWVNESTGEVREFDIFEKPVHSRNGFMITYLTEVIKLIDTLGNKKMLIVKYILNNMNKAENTLIKTQREIAKETGISIKTVNETLKILQNAKIIERKTGAIMVSPKLMNNWKNTKEQSMMIKFINWEKSDKQQVDNE